MRKIIGAAAGAVALSVGGLAPVAFAEDGVVEGFILAASPWKTLDTGPGEVWTPTTPTHDSELSVFTDATTVELTWSDDVENASLGTSAETEGLGVAVSANDVISVDYELIDADPAAGSVRLFASIGAAPLADTAPDDGSTSGTLSLTVPTDGTLGAMGLVYDTSNGGVEGTVRFSDLTVGGVPVLFVPPAEPTIAQPTCEQPMGVVTVPDAPGYAYALEGAAAEAGTHDVAPGDHEVTATLADTTVVVQTWVLTATEPTGCSGADDGAEDGGESGTDDGADDGGESGTDDGGAAGTDDGGESGTDDGGAAGADDGGESGTDDGTPTPSADDCDAYENSAAWCDPGQADYDCSDIDDAHKPIQLVDAGTDPFLLDSDDDGVGCEVSGDDDGTSDDDGTGDDDGDLPDTGAGSSLLWAGIAMLVLGGLAALFARYRQRSSSATGSA